MTLYNKDGTVYKLKGPNPAMKGQEIWGEFSTHNMSWKNEVHKDLGKNNSTLVKAAAATTHSDSFINELESSKEDYAQEEPVLDEPLPTQTKKPPEPEQKDHKPNRLASEGIEKIFVHCLPAVTTERKDSLYGDVSTRTHYKDKTSFEAVVINQSDVKIEIWSEVFFQSGSILYPRNGDKRWWKVQDHYPKLGGFIMQAVPSQDQPYFE